MSDTTTLIANAVGALVSTHVSALLTGVLLGMALLTWWQAKVLGSPRDRH